MCLAVPGKVIEVWETGATRMAKVDFAGVLKDVSAAFVPQLDVGDYVLVHVGLALQRLDEQSALDTLTLFESLAAPDAIVADPVEATR